MTPSDHLIQNEASYQKVLAHAKELALVNNLVTFGITPTFAQTGFGYIESDGEDVKAFHEKPDFETATRYLQAGNYYWNSGMFMFRAGVFLEELRTYAPEIFRTCQEAFKAVSLSNTNQAAPKLLRVKHEDMAAIPEDSIDYAVMGK